MRNVEKVLLVTCLSALALSISVAQTRVIGYYPMWSRSSLPPSSIVYTSLTHIMHAFAWPNADGTIGADQSSPDLDLTSRAHAAGVKVLISLGGASSSSYFSPVLADSVHRHAFIKNIVTYVTNGNYDGADLDWEGPSSTADRANELVFVKELRAAFTAANPAWLLTMAVGTSDWSGQWRDFTSLKGYIDWFGAMTYDYHGSWSAHAGHNAPLFAPATDVDDWSVDQGMKYLATTRNISAAQLVVGLPFYGRTFNASALYGPKTEPTTDIEYQGVPPLRSAGWNYVWDAVSQVPYLTSPSKTQLVTFDDSTSLSIKCAYARAKKYSGVMIWALGQDGPTQPLLAAVAKAMAGTNSVAEGTAPIHPASFALSEGYPNPCNPSALFDLTVVDRSRVRVEVNDILGRTVAVLVDEERESGTYHVRFDGDGLASGVYFVRLSAGATVVTRKIDLIR